MKTKYSDSSIYLSKIILLFLTVLFLNLTGCQRTVHLSSENDQLIRKDKNDKKYLFYLHGRIIEDQGAENAVSEKFGKYEYQKILKTFEDAGFQVISEARPKDTDADKYADKIVGEIKLLLEAETTAKQITVVGASKGSLIAQLISTRLANKSVNFVLMANCNKWVEENYQINLHGRILSIYEKSDTIGGNSCESIKNNSKGISEYKEIEINTKLDHGFLYKPLKEWVEPTISWAKN
jgi:hypothetical protein